MRKSSTLIPRVLLCRGINKEINKSHVSALAKCGWLWRRGCSLHSYATLSRLPHDHIQRKLFGEHLGRSVSGPTIAEGFRFAFLLPSHDRSLTPRAPLPTPTTATHVAPELSNEYIASDSPCASYFTLATSVNDRD